MNRTSKRSTQLKHVLALGACISIAAASAQPGPVGTGTPTMPCMVVVGGVTYPCGVVTQGGVGGDPTIIPTLPTDTFQLVLREVALVAARRAVRTVAFEVPASGATLVRLADRTVTFAAADKAAGTARMKSRAGTCTLTSNVAAARGAVLTYTCRVAR